MKTFVSIFQKLMLTCAAGLALVAGTPAAALESDAEIREILRERIDVSKRGVGIVVGIVDANGRRVIAYGKADKATDQPLDGDSIFMIASVTKTFTALLLADMVQRGEVNLDDPISKFLPPTVKTPKVNGQEITLLQLSRHTSGLPRTATNYKPKNAADFYADFNADVLYAFLNEYKTSLPIGKRHQYSNLGFHLLGHLLEVRAGKNYEALLRERILDPLQMRSTAVNLSPALKTHLTATYSERNLPIPRMGTFGLPGAGALHSSANDLLTYLEANLGLRETTLTPTMQTTHFTTADKISTDLDLGLGWNHQQLQHTKIIQHGGAVPGYRTFVGFDVKGRRGVVVLANAETDIHNLGVHFLENTIPIFKPTPLKEFKAVKLDTKLLEAALGKYRHESSGSVYTFSLEGERMFVTTQSGRKDEFFAESETSFFRAGGAGWLTATRDQTGRVTRVVWNTENGPGGMSAPAFVRVD